MGNWFDNLFSDETPLSGGDKVETAVRIGEWTANTGGDTNIGGRTSKVCLDCVSGFMTEAGLPMPSTSSVPVFIDAMEGNKVRLWEHDEMAMTTVEGDPRVWADHKKYARVDNPKDLQPGDILIVESHNNQYHGLHSALVTNVEGTSEGWSMFTGVDIVHDKGSAYNVQQDQYEWWELEHGEGKGSQQGNRKFHTAYRYIGD